MYEIDNLPGCIEIGNQDEKGAGISPVIFNVSAWEGVYTGFDYSITYIRPGETSVSPELGSAVSKAVADGVTTVTWAPSDAVLNIAGHGSVIVHCSKDGDEKRSAMTAYYVAPGHAAAGEAPDPVTDWIEGATSKLAEVDHFIGETIEATESANEAAARAENGENERENAEGLRVIAEQGRHDAYELAEAARDGLYVTAESARDGLYDAAESDRDGLFEAAETTRNTQTGDAIDRANAIRETLEGIAPLWADVDISVSALSEGTDPTASITQDVTGTSITLGIPKGDTGAQGPVGNVMFATFGIIDGDLIVTTPDGYTGPTFSIINNELEVSI